MQANRRAAAALSNRLLRAAGRLGAALLTFLLVLLAGVGQASASGLTKPTPATELRAGRPFVLVVIDDADKALVASEAYGDWHAGYERFVASGHGALPVYTLAPRLARASLPALGASAANATVFVDAAGRGLMHEGLVLEPRVYVIGRAFAETGEVAPQAQDYGLRPTALK